MNAFFEKLHKIENQGNNASPSDITHLLFEFQTEVTVKHFSEQRLNIKDDFFSLFQFFAFAAAHDSPTVRLASYRATGAFLLNFFPYFPEEIQSTFSDFSMASTIDLRSTGIIAASFAFITKFIAIPNLQPYLDITPVFHHFTSSDPTFTEYISVIVSNLGNLNSDWFNTLLHSFLEKTLVSNERYLFKAISAIVNHRQDELLPELLHSSENISLISYVLSTLNGAVNNLSPKDYYIISKQPFLSLNNPSSNPSIVDSSFSVLSLNPEIIISEISNNNDQANNKDHNGQTNNKDNDQMNNKDNDQNNNSEVLQIEYRDLMCQIQLLQVI